MAKQIGALSVGLGLDSAQFQKGIADAKRASKDFETSQRAAGKASAQFANDARNVGFQVQDMAVQIAAGTSVTTALGQQLPQLLGSFGLLGVAMGTIVAVGIPLVSVFLSMGQDLRDLKDRTTDVVAASDSLAETINTNDKNAQDLVKTYRADWIPAIVSIGKQLQLVKEVRFENELKSWAIGMRDLIDGTDGWLNKLIFGYQVLGKVIGQFEWKGGGIATLVDIFKKLGDTNLGKIYDEVAAENAKKALGLTTDQVTKLQTAIDKLKGNNTKEGLKDFAKSIEGLGLTRGQLSKFLTPEQLKAYESLLETADKLTRGQGKKTDAQKEREKEGPANDALARYELQVQQEINKLVDEYNLKLAKTSEEERDRLAKAAAQEEEHWRKINEEIAMYVNQLGVANAAYNEKLHKQAVETFARDIANVSQQGDLKGGIFHAFLFGLPADLTEFNKGVEIGKSLFGNLENAIDNLARTGKLKFKDLARSIITDLLAIELKASASKLLRGLLGGLDLFGGGGSTSGFSYYGRAEGGSVNAGQTYLVGERGPELFTPSTQGGITSNANLGSGQQSIVNNWNVQTFGPQDFQQYLLSNSTAVFAASNYGSKQLQLGRGRA